MESECVASEGEGCKKDVRKEVRDEVSDGTVSHSEDAV